MMALMVCFLQGMGEDASASWFSSLCLEVLLFKGKAGSASMTQLLISVSSWASNCEHFFSACWNLTSSLKRLVWAAMVSMELAKCSCKTGLLSSPYLILMSGYSLRHLERQSLRSMYLNIIPVSTLKSALMSSFCLASSGPFTASDVFMDMYCPTSKALPTPICLTWASKTSWRCLASTWGVGPLLDPPLEDIFLWASTGYTIPFLLAAQPSWIIGCPAICLCLAVQPYCDSNIVAVQPSQSGFGCPAICFCWLSSHPEGKVGCPAIFLCACVCKNPYFLCKFWNLKNQYFEAKNQYF